MELLRAMSVLRTKGWLSRQDRTFQDALLDGATPRYIAPGEAVYDLAADADGFFGLADGFLDVLIAPGQATPSLAHIARPGWWFGEAALINRSPRRGHITARTKSTLLFFSEHHVTDLQRQHPDVWRRIAGITVDQLDLALALGAGYAAKDVGTQVRYALCRLFEPKNPTLTLPVTQSEIAEIAGLSRNATGTVLKALEARGVIEIGYRNLRVLAFDKLQDDT